MIEARELGGVGVFHLMNDRLMRSRGLAGNHCLLVLELERHIDLPKLDIRLERAVSAVPELRFRLDQRLLGRPSWVIDHGRPAPSLELRDARPGMAGLEDSLRSRLDGDHPWAVDVLRGDERDTIIFRWFHSLLDARGAERLVTWLGSGDGDSPLDPPPPEERYEDSTRPLAGMDRDAKIALTKAYNAHVLALGREPILSLDSAPVRAARGKSDARSTLGALVGRLGLPISLPARGAAGETRIVRIVLSVEETRAFDARARKRAKLAESSVMLHAAARVFDRALMGSGFAPRHYVVPVPLSLDPKAGCRRILGNNLTMMLLSLDREDLADEARAYAHLAEQQRAIVRDKLDVGMLAALDLASYLPTAPYRWIADRPFHGEMASFIFSNPGALSISSFAGVPVRDAYPLPAAVLPPGFQIVFSRFGGRLSAALVYAEAVLDEREASRLAEALKAELLADGHGAP